MRQKYICNIFVCLLNKNKQFRIILRSVCQFPVDLVLLPVNNLINSREEAEINLRSGINHFFSLQFSGMEKWYKII